MNEKTLEERIAALELDMYGEGGAQGDVKTELIAMAIVGIFTVGLITSAWLVKKGVAMGVGAIDDFVEDRKAKRKEKAKQKRE
jgi:hypothetical protein